MQQLISAEFPNLVEGLSPGSIDISDRPQLNPTSQNVSVGRYFGMGPRFGMSLTPFSAPALTPFQNIGGLYFAGRFGGFSEFDSTAENKAIYNDNCYLFVQQNSGNFTVGYGRQGTGKAWGAAYLAPYIAAEYNPAQATAKKNDIFSAIIKRIPTKKFKTKGIVARNANTTPYNTFYLRYFGTTFQGFDYSKMPSSVDINRVKVITSSTGAYRVDLGTPTISSYTWGRIITTQTMATDAGIVLFGEKFEIDSVGSFLFVANKKAEIFTIKDHQDAIILPYSGSSAPSETVIKQITSTAQERLVRSIATIDQTNYANKYTENGERKNTCWNVFPSFTTGSALALKSGASKQPFSIDNATPGIFRANTVYELAFSIFDKSLNHETNVGDPAKFQTGADDFVSLTLFNNGNSTGASPEDFTTLAARSPFISPITKIEDRILENLNSIEYRVYYRAEGETEWKPCFQIDAVRAHFDSTIYAERIGKNPVALQTGGQPGGIIDYSPLADDEWLQVADYRDRVFWISRKQMCFSRRSAFLSYPVGNYLASPQGDFLGAVAHAYPGQAQQDSRLVVFGSTAVYIGRFRGPEYQLEQTVQVSADNAVTIPVDGSDFALDAWTSSTAHSFRSVIIADGILYWWGSKGIYRDSGAALPERISAQDIEPDLFDWLDNHKTDEIHAIYSAETKEIVWFFQPKKSFHQKIINLVDTEASCGLVYHTISGKFSLWYFDEKITHSQQLETVYDPTNTRSESFAGLRNVISVGKDEKLPVFFDSRNYTMTDLSTLSTVVTKVEVGSDASKVRLTLQGQFGGAAGTPYANPSVGEKFLLKNYGAYRPNASFSGSIPSDSTYTITNFTPAGGGVIFPFIEIDKGSYDWQTTGQLDPDEYFPIYFQRQGFPVRIHFDHIAPWGLNSWVRWLNFHTWFKYIGVTGGNNQITASWNTLIGNVNDNSRTLALTNNSKNGNCQIYSHFLLHDQNGEGQALQLKFEQEQVFGDYWVLQYLRFDCTPISVGNIKMFEG